MVGDYLKYQQSYPFAEKKRFSPDFLFEEEGFSFFYTYIRKNASTSFKKLFQLMFPEACPGELPSVGCMAKHAQVKGLAPEEIDQRFETKLFVYRDPVDRVFSVYKNKLIQQDGADDLLKRLTQVVKRDPGLLTFEEFVNEYVVLLKTERWQEVDGHLYPQVWHLLPITYNKVIPMTSVYDEMREILPAALCDQVFLEPSNSTTKGSVPITFCDPDCPAIYFRKKYVQTKALPSLQQVLTPQTEALLKRIYADDYRMIEEVERQRALDSFSVSLGDRSAVMGAELSSDTHEALEAHVRFRSPDMVLQFGISAVTLSLALAMKSGKAGRLLCVAEPGEALDALRSCVRENELEAVLTIMPTPLEDWVYRYPEGCDSALKRWFSEAVVDQLPPLDWVVVDGPDWQGQPCTRYPALPSVLELLAPGAEVWMLGVEDPRVQEVVSAWCIAHPVSADAVSTDGIIRIHP